VFIYAALSPIIVRQAIGWMTRRRSAGALVLDLSSRDRAIRLPVAMFVMVAVAAETARHGIQPWYAYVGYLSAVLVVGLHGRLEIRSRGIIYYGSLYTWENIESYEWRGDPQVGLRSLITLKLNRSLSEANLLKLHLRRSVHFLPPARVPIPDGRHDEVEAIIRRYLSDWPAAQEAVPTQ
jgi:hypothetical protein